jgi:hemoglobin
MANSNVLATTLICLAISASIFVFLCIFDRANLLHAIFGKKQTSIVDKIGGEAAIDRIVGRFYDKVLNDRRIAHHFLNANIPRVRRMQTKFLTFAFGGAAEFDGKSLKLAHAHLDLRDCDFDAVMENLCAVMTELGLKRAVIREAMDVVESRRDDVVNSTVR